MHDPDIKVGDYHQRHGNKINSVHGSPALQVRKPARGRLVNEDAEGDTQHRADVFVQAVDNLFMISMNIVERIIAQIVVMK